MNIVGDHATYHKQYDAPLESDIDAIASAVSGWTRRSMTPDAVASDTAEAVYEAMGPPGKVATLILPADSSWSPAEGAAPRLPRRVPDVVPSDRITDVAKAIRTGQPVAFLIGGRAMRADGLLAAARVASESGATLLCETFPSRQERGAGLPNVERLAYLAEFAQMQLQDARHLVLVDAAAPVSFFAYPDKAIGARARRLRDPRAGVGCRGPDRRADGAGRRARRARRASRRRCRAGRTGRRAR